MPNKILITRDLSVAARGNSQPHIMADDSGAEYFVKFKENAQNTVKVLVNEFVAGSIAEHLGLPSPETFIAEIDPMLASTIQVNGQQISTGSHFATKRLANVYNITRPMVPYFITSCSNSDKYAPIISFDIYTFNVDRNNIGNFLIIRKGTTFEFFIIDNGHCFNFAWDENMLPQLVGLWPYNGVLAAMVTQITAASNFDAAITNIENIDNIFINNLVDDIPKDWILTANESTALKYYLKNQRQRLRQLIFNNKHLFTNWQ